MTYEVGEADQARSVSTLLHFLSPRGGFAGGPANTQIPHLLPTYAATCSLAIVGHPGSGGGWAELAAARQGVYDFFMSCKRPDGGFVVSEGGEVDVRLVLLILMIPFSKETENLETRLTGDDIALIEYRGTYCLLVVATLLDIITPELVHNVDKFIAGCQTYEGGFACASFPFGHFRAAQAEAHGGYTSCAINSHFLLSSIRPSRSSPPSEDPKRGIDTVSSLEDSFPAAIDTEAALRWSAMQQCEAIEGGGFRGRSNKLVDGCYSWWVGGGIPVLEALQKRAEGSGEDETSEP